MRSAILTLLISFAFCTPSAHSAASYNGTWNFNMKAVKTTCEDVKIGDARSVSLVLSQATPTKKMLTATLPENVVGVSASYTGYIMKNGVIASLSQSCPIVPDAICATGSQTFTFLDSSKKSTKVVWLDVKRTDNNAYTCTTVYSGTAKKKKVSKK